MGRRRAAGQAARKKAGKKLWSRLGESPCDIFSFHKMSLA